MRREWVARGSSRLVREAAEEHLREGGDAVGAAVAGYFAAAGASAGVLFGPLSLLVAQVGVGVRAFDGRCRQPGIGGRRGRAFAAGEPIPKSARVATPGGVGALLVALRYGRGTSLRRVLSAGISGARELGCERRADVLDAIQRLGAAALSDPLVARPLVYRAGRSEGGALSAADLASVGELDHPASRTDGACEVPWAAAGPDASAGRLLDEAARQRGVAVADASGGVALLCYDEVDEGLEVEELELVLPLKACAAVRGQRRVKPGQVLESPAPLRIELDERGVPLTGSVRLAGRDPLTVTVTERGAPVLEG